MDNFPTKVDFAILGGGIAGLSAAIGLEKCGAKATVFEAAPAFKPVGAGLVLAPNAIKAYEYLGVHEKVINAGNLLEHFNILSQSGKVITSTLPTSTEQRWSGCSIHRADLHDVLLGELQNTEIYLGKRTLNLEPRGEDQIVHFEDGSKVVAQHVVVAEGIHSPIRSQLLLESRERYAGYTCWRGIANGLNFQGNHSSETWGKNGRFGIVPLNDNRVYWFAVKNATAQSERMRLYTKQDLKLNFKEYHPQVIKTIDSTRQDHIFWNDIMDLKPLSSYAFDKVLLMGDAAHATTPNMGQGACMAIEDAAVLSHCLHTISPVSNAFKQFEKMRMKRTRGIVTQSWSLGKIAQWEHPIGIAVRNTLFRSVPKALSQKQLQKLTDFRLDRASVE